LNNPLESIKLNDVTFGYDNGNVLDNLVLNIARFYEPGGGQILINGISLSGVSREDWSKKITLVRRFSKRFQLLFQFSILKFHVLMKH
jgi:ABC-type transport system involved in cytochrome bd biosynthesis fused ATPase/permease subunit